MPPLSPPLRPARPPRVRRLSPALLALTAAFAPGCGLGTAVVGSLDSEDPAPTAATVVSDAEVGADPADPRVSPVEVAFRLTNALSLPASVEVAYQPPGGAPEQPALLVGGPGLDSLATSPAGVVHTRQWDFASQVPGGASYTSGHRLVVRTSDGSSEAGTALFALGNDAPVVAGLVGPAGEAGDVVRVDLVVSDTSSDATSILVEYDDLGDGAGFQPATPAGPPLASVAATPGGVSAVFFWNAGADEPGEELAARLRFTPSDVTHTGTPATLDLVVDNNEAPLALVSGSAFFATPDDRRGIPLPVTIVEKEGDPLRFVVQWRTPFQAFPALPSSPAALDAILDDPVQRRAYRVATERVREHRGRVVPTAAADRVRLPELAGGAAALQAEGPVGRELELLRPTGVPAGVAASWSSNPLAAPVALLARGPSALVLEAAGGGWRLVRIDLGTGALAATVATDAGRAPSALAESFDDPGVVLVADDAGGVWRVAAVELATGTVTPVATATGATELGTVRGLAATGAATTLLTVGSSLVQVDATDPMAPTESALFADFAAPRGIAFDRATGRRLFLAERDWTDPVSMAVPGRVAAIDLTSHARATVVATGAPFERPEAVALERGGARLLALTDSDPMDGFRELRAVELGGGDGGAAFEVTPSLDADATGLAAGADGLRLVALSGAADVAVGGGVAQARAITAFDPATSVATVDAPFDPAPAALQPWRIRDAFGAAGGSPGGRTDVFVWESTDLDQAGQVVLRVTPYDSETGLATDTAVPRAVRAAVDVTPVTQGGPGSTDGVRGLALADVDDDGRLDLVTANGDGDDLAIFYQTAQGEFPATPDVTLSGIPILAPTNEPVGVVVIDADDDGDLDVISVNRGSDNFNVFEQSLPGVFTTLSPLLVLGLDQPSDVAAGDVNGDGLVDVVIADTGDDQIEVFHQLPGGLFGLAADSTLGDATTQGPVAVDVADLDGDGDLDIVSSNTTSDTVTVFLQGAPGVFAAAPSFVLGGPGVTDDPTDVVAADLDGDGLVDLATANNAGNDLTVFLQGAGGFSPVPDHVLADSTGPIQPRTVAASDVNADGSLDLVSANANGDVTVFYFDALSGTFAAAPMVASGGGTVVDPSGLAIGDVDGDGFLDLAVGEATGDAVAIYFHDGGSSFAAAPSLLLGSPTDTPGPEALVCADLDGDGDLDLASANAGNGTVAVFEQFSPAVLAAVPGAVLSSSAVTPGVRAIAAADLDGDGRVDLVTGSAGELAVFLQSASGDFPLAPDQVAGGGALGAPAAVAVLDLDADGDLDLVAAEETGDVLSVFRQGAPGVFSASPDAVLGSAAATNGPRHVVAADLDGDGDDDLASANTGGGDVALFLQTAGGFPALPDRTLGGAGATDGVCALAAEDLDGDGDLDLAAACEDEDAVALFFQTAPGVFPAAPDALLADALVDAPTALACADLDHDGDRDLVAGNAGAPSLVPLRGTTPGAFAVGPNALGGAGSVDAPRALVAVDLDGDGDVDLAAAHPTLDRLSVFFASH